MNKPNNQSTLEAWVDWLLHLHAKEIDLGLTRISQVANDMDLLRPAPIVITVAGTNGKGSSVAMLASILEASGYRVGTYTSPHIVSFTERIRINGKPVCEHQIIEAFNQIEIDRQNTKLTYFEFATLAALSVFKAYSLDVVVLEVGLGGRLDAVNVVDADATLITAIDIDHVEWLGDNRSVIATEKAGVMRTEQLSVCSDPDVPNSLIEHADNLKTELYVLNRDYHVEMLDCGWRLNTENSTAAYEKPALKGDFQIQNAAGVVTLLKKLAERYPQIEIFDSTIDTGLKQVAHAGRLEQRDVDGQFWLIDVAHNPQSAKVLADYLQTQNASGLTAIFSALSDKDMVPMVRVIKPFVKQWHIADLAIPRSSDLQKLQTVLAQAGIDASQVVEHANVNQAVHAVKLQKQSSVLVWGSFFTVAQTIEALEKVG